MALGLSAYELTLGLPSLQGRFAFDDNTDDGLVRVEGFPYPTDEYDSALTENALHRLDVELTFTSVALKMPDFYWHEKVRDIVFVKRVIS